MESKKITERKREVPILGDKGSQALSQVFEERRKLALERIAVLVKNIPKSQKGIKTDMKMILDEIVKAQLTFEDINEIIKTLE